MIAPRLTPVLIALALGMPGLAFAQTWQAQPDGVVITPAASSARKVRLQVMSDRIIRVTAAPTESLDLPRSLMVIASPITHGFKVAEQAGKVVLTTPTTTAEVSLQTGAVSFRDASGKVVLAEQPRGAFTPVTVEGQPFVSVRQQFNPGTSEGFYEVRNGIEPCIARGRAYAEYADLLWMETGKPDLEVARAFAEGIKSEFPDQLLAYNCSPSFNWKKHLDDDEIAKFQRELGAMGFRFQFITLAGFHALNHSMFDLAKGYAEHDMTAYVALQEREFAAERDGYTATKHQREVGTGWFDMVATALNPTSGTLALAGSTESEQFH